MADPKASGTAYPLDQEGFQRSQAIAKTCAAAHSNEFIDVESVSMHSYDFSIARPCTREFYDDLSAQIRSAGFAWVENVAETRIRLALSDQ